MDPKVVIVDYGVGNLLSLQRALEACEAKPIISKNPREVQAADRLILPGVGSFSHGMNCLRERGLDEALLEFARTGRPLLGICLGMQLLFQMSEEFGKHPGLGLLRGGVTRLPSGCGKIPNVGWRSIHPSQSQGWKQTLLRALDGRPFVYFVHSYAACPSAGADQIATYNFGKEPVCAAVQREGVVGCQFHPEKSGPVGLRILKGFLQF